MPIGHIGHISFFPKGFRISLEKVADDVSRKKYLVTPFANQTKIYDSEGDFPFYSLVSDYQYQLTIGFSGDRLVGRLRMIAVSEGATRVNLTDGRIVRGGMTFTIDDDHIALIVEPAPDDKKAVVVYHAFYWIP